MQVASVLSSLGSDVVQDEREMLEEMGDWHDHISDLLDAKAKKRCVGEHTHIEEIAVGELPARVAGWCQDVGTEAASSLAKKATSLLPRSTTVDWQQPRRKGTTSTGNGGRERGTGHGSEKSLLARSGKRSWLTSTVSSALSLLSRSPSKAGVLSKEPSNGQEAGGRSRGGQKNVAVRRENSDISAERPRSDRELFARTRRTKSDVDIDYQLPDAGAGARRPSSMRSQRRSAFIEIASDEGVSEHTERRERYDSGNGADGNTRHPGRVHDRERTTRERAGAKAEAVRAGVGEGGSKQETLQTQLLRMPYYLFQGLVLITFVTDKAADMESLSDMRKKVLVAVMALSIGNFFSSTTTARSHIIFLALRSICDLVNISHALCLILLGIWLPALSTSGRALAEWLAHFPSLAAFLGISQTQVGPILGTFNLITGLLRVAADLKIDTHPLPSELPVVVTGLVLLVIIPANVTLPEDNNGTGDGAAGFRFAGGAVGAASEAHGAGGWQGADGAGAGLLGLGDVREMPWCSCHVLTTSLVVALLNLAAPPQRGIGAPLMVMIFNSIWSLAVSCAGVLTGPAALPWPGLPFFTTLSVLSLLISKHLLV